MSQTHVIDGRRFKVSGLLHTKLKYGFFDRKPPWHESTTSAELREVLARDPLRFSKNFGKKTLAELEAILEMLEGPQAGPWRFCPWCGRPIAEPTRGVWVHPCPTPSKIPLSRRGRNYLKP